MIRLFLIGTDLACSRRGAPQGSGKGMDSVSYIRKWPWRPRSPWLGNRMGARRRGFRQDALGPAPDVLYDGMDAVMDVGTETALMDDIVLAEAVAQTVPSAAAPRVDVSGLLAIASVAPNPVSLSHGQAALPADWHAHGARGDEESLLTRHSA